MLNLSHPSSQEHSVENTRHSMLLNRILLVTGGIWIAVMMAIAVFALNELFHPGTPEQQVSSPISPPSSTTFDRGDSPTQEETPVEPEIKPESDILRSPPSEVVSPPPSPSETPDLPLWVFGAIATVCASGSLGVTILLKQLMGNKDSVKVEPKPKKAVKPSPKPKKTPKNRKFQVSQSKVVQSKPKKRPVRKPQPQAVRTKKGHRPGTSPQPVPPQPQPQPIFEPIVTVIPPEAKTPMDRSQPDLAEMMDLRKRRSLAALMRDLDT